MKTAIIAIIAACTAMAAITEDRMAQFAQWAAQHGKTYEGEEAHRRLEIFSAKAEAIEEHNAKGLPWTMGLNEFSDLTNEEFAAIYTGGFKGASHNVSDLTKVARRTQGQGSLPPSVDWTAAGAVTPVKTQQRMMCGSDYAFSAAGAIEGIDFIKNGGPVTSLSVQQIVDCSGPYTNNGCGGGTMIMSFHYAQQVFGLTHDVDYPYTAQDGTCQCNGMAPPCLVRVPITTFSTVPSGSEQDLMAAVARQPISVAVSAQSLNFQNYHSGVMTAPCGTHLDTGMLLVGYGTLNGQDYWKVKNQWGTTWGDQGYILLGRGPQFGAAGQCGIQMDASYPEIL